MVLAGVWVAGGLGSRKDTDWDPTCAVYSCLTLGMLLNLSGLFSHAKNDDF